MHLAARLRPVTTLVLAIFFAGSGVACAASEESTSPFAAGRMVTFGSHTFEELESFLGDDNNRDPRLVGSSRGDELTVAVLYWECADRNETPRVAFSEESRKTRLQEGFKHLKDLRPALLEEDPNAPPPPPCKPGWATSKRRLVERRAKLVITAEMASEVASELAADPFQADWLVVVDLRINEENNQGKFENLETLAITLFTGPREPWLISAAIPLNDVNQLKYDSSSMEIELREEQKTFYFSLDYTLGDALLERPRFCQALTFKLLLAASKDPLHSVGAGIGLMPGWFSRLDERLKILDTLSPWVGFTFTEQDEISGDGSVSHEGDRNNEFRAGVSLSLTEVSGWFKKGE